MADPRDWAPSGHLLAIKINAGHDRNGNPRRGWIIVSTRTGETVDFVDEGYRGWQALRRRFPNAVEGPEIPTSPSVYRELLREYRE